MRGAYWIAPTRCGSSRQPDSERSSCYLICMAKRLRRREAGRAFGNQARVLAVGEVRRPECGQCRLCQRRGRKKQFASCDMTAALVRSSQKRQRTLRSCAGLKAKCFRVAPCLSSRPIFFAKPSPEKALGINKAADAFPDFDRQSVKRFSSHVQKWCARSALRELRKE